MDKKLLNKLVHMRWLDVDLPDHVAVERFVQAALKPLREWLQEAESVHDTEGSSTWLEAFRMKLEELYGEEAG